MEETFVIGQDFTDNVGLTVTKETRETFVSVQGDKKTGEEFTSTESLIESVATIIIIDAEDYVEETAESDQYRLDEIWHNIQPLTVLYKVKENLAKELSLVNVMPGNFNDFNLESMGSLEGEISFRRLSENENSIHRTFEKSIPLYYLASLLVKYVREHTENVDTKKLLQTQQEHLLNVCKVLENAVEVNGWPVPDLESTVDKFDHFKARLPELVDEYLTNVPESRSPSIRIERSGPKLLPQLKQFVINYEIVSEVERAVSRLHHVFGIMKKKVLGDENKGFGLYAEITERSTSWAVNDESETREHYA